MASAHLDSLTAKHARLESSLSEELQRPVPDAARCADLKKQKLRLKEEIGRELH